MLVSIIVPVYNVKDYLIRCLDSIHNQIFDDFEVIVVDDGSTDGCSQMIDEYCKGKEKFRAFHKKNGGVTSAWMYGVEKANGEYIGFVDSDDYVSPEMYQTMSERIKKNGADIILCNHYYDSRDINGKLRIHRNPIRDGFYRNEMLHQMKNNIIPVLGSDYISPARWNKLVKKELLISNLRYCDTCVSSADDVNIMVPCMLACKSFEYIDQPLYYYVRRLNSISHVLKKQILDTYPFVIENLTQAAVDWNTNLSERCQKLYNFYGVVWCTYVAQSGLSKEEKVAQIARLFSEQKFVQNSKKICRDNGTVAAIYKIMMALKMPQIYLTGYKYFQILLKILRRK